MHRLQAVAQRHGKEPVAHPIDASTSATIPPLPNASTFVGLRPERYSLRSSLSILEDSQDFEGSVSDQTLRMNVSAINLLVCVNPPLLMWFMEQ